MASCNVDDHVGGLNTDEVVFYAQNGDMPGTKTSLQADGTINWLPQDEISILYRDNLSARFVSDNTEPSGKVTFKGKMEGYSFRESSTVWAVYPYREGIVFGEDFVIVDIPSEQKAVAGTFADDLFVSVAKTNDFNLYFYNVCGGVKFCITEENVTKIKFRGGNEEVLAGTVRVGIGNDGKPAVTEVLDPAHSITLTPQGEDYFRTGTWYYLASLPTDLEGGYSFTLIKGDGTSAIKGNTKPVAIERSVWGVLEDMDKGLSYEERVPENEIWYTTTDGMIIESMPEGLISNEYKDGMGRMVFNHCLKTVENNFFNYDSRLETVRLPENIVEIGFNSFCICENLKSIEMPGVVRIGEQAFASSGLSGVLELPETLEEIGASAFIQCEGISEIIIPRNVKTIDDFAFGAGNYSKITVQATVPPVLRGSFDSRFDIGSRGGDYTGLAGGIVLVPEESIELYLTADGWSDYIGIMSVEGKMPTEFWYASTDYSRDKEVVILQEPTVGKGIDLIFMGDGFVDRDLVPGGEFEKRVRMEIEEFFSIEPFRTYRNRFRVSMVMCVSKYDIYFSPYGCDRLFTCDDLSSGWNQYTVYEEIARERSKLVTKSETKPYFSAILMKAQEGQRNYTVLSSDKMSQVFAICSSGYRNGNYMKCGTIAHEIGGHGIGLLADEYIGVGRVFTEGQRFDFDFFLQETGYGVNVDWHSNPAEVRWNHFFMNPDYMKEGLGVWEGAYVYEFGMYRPSENSIMNDNEQCRWFNAPSREQIYKQIMKYSEGDEWMYDYNTFLEVDAPWREDAAKKYEEWKNTLSTD